MTKYILKFALFLLPLGLLFVFPLFVYWQGREFSSVASVIDTQHTATSTLFGLAYDNETRAYKEALVVKKQPEIIALGTSRVMELRGSFFKQPDVFVNAGGAITDVSALAPELKTLYESDPNLKVVILGLDPWMFKPGHTSEDAKQQIGFWDKVQTFLGGGWRVPYTDFAQHKFTINELMRTNTQSQDIGLNALLYKNGFLNDGSYFYGKTITSAQPAEALQELIFTKVATIHADRSSYEYGTTTDQLSLADVNAMLAYAHEHNIYVIGFIPPYQPTVYAELVSTNDAYSSEVQQLSIDFSQVFQQYQFPFHDFTNSRRANIKPTEFIDDVHASDKADLRILIDIAQKDRVLQSFVSVSSLMTIFSNTSSDYIYK